MISLSVEIMTYSGFRVIILECKNTRQTFTFTNREMAEAPEMETSYADHFDNMSSKEPDIINESQRKFKLCIYGHIQ